MKRIAAASLAALGFVAVQADAGTNPVGRATGLDRAAARMSAQGAAHQRATLNANPAARGPSNAHAATPATPATPAVPNPGTGTPATPAVPATPAKPPRPKEPVE
jgi:hypothetical protein